MSLGRFSPKLLIAILLAVCFFVAYYFRTVLPYDQVFSGDWIKFTSIDAYYHMRLVDNLAQNFPHIMHFDPYFIYPSGAAVSGIQFFDWLLAGIIWVVGLGSPTQHTIDVMGAYFPAILAALTVIPVYAIGRALFNRWAGVLAAALVAVFAGEFMGRSIIGFTDQHIAETLFSTVAVLFLMLAIKTARQRQLTLGHLRQGDRAISTRPLVYGLLAGVFLGIYLITWGGALLFVFIITLYFIIQFIIDHLRRKSTDYLGITGVIAFLIALIIFLPFSSGGLALTALVLAVIIPLVLLVISRVMAARQIRSVYYPLALVVMAVAGLAVFYAVNPGLLGQMLAAFKIFNPAGSTAATTLEMQHFLSPHGSFSTMIAWGNYTTSFFLLPPDWGLKNMWFPPGFAIIALIILIVLIIKRRGDEEHRLLFLIWTLVILAATLVQRRFAYYLVVNLALLSAYLSWLAIWYAGLRKLTARQEEKEAGEPEKTARARVKKRRKEGQGLALSYIYVGLTIIAVFLVVILPNIFKAQDVASTARFAPSNAWQSSLIWLRENTPDPFDRAGFYYERYEPPPPGESYEYPESAYGVTAWWDYGYWITRTAHRLPSANPAQSPEPIIKVANLFLSQEEASAREIMAELGSSYLIADYAITTSKFHALVTWAGREQGEFTGVYYVPSEGKLVPVPVFYPEYYRSMCVRLYNFDGEAVTSERPAVLTYIEEVSPEGIPYRRITVYKEFSSYQGALDYVAGQGSANHRIVGVNRFISPVPLEAVPDYKLIHSSESGVSHPDIGLIPEVKVFEYIGD